jgi:hypothetical protein
MTDAQQAAERCYGETIEAIVGRIGSVVSFATRNAYLPAARAAS